MRFTTTELLCFGLVFLIGTDSNPAFGQQPSNAEALKLITKTANEICQSAPLEETSSGMDLSGDAKAKLGGIVGKIADLQITGSGGYKSEGSVGLLQKDLIAALQSSNNCKLVVFRTLERDLLATHEYKALAIHPRSSPSELQREADGFTFQMQGCAHIGQDAVKCSFTVINSEADRVLTVFSWSGGTFMLDSHGIMHSATTAEIGASHGHPAATLVASGVPVDGSITYGGDGRMIDGIARLSIGIIVDETNGNAPPFKIKWSDVPLEATLQ